MRQPLHLPPALAWIFTAALFVALSAFGAWTHWVEEVGTAERDGYVVQAERILQGELPRDPYRPPLYSLATAALSLATALTPFDAARLLSNLAAAALVLLAFCLARRLVGPEADEGTRRRAGFGALALTAVNPNLWILGQHVATDMFFAALAAGVFLVGLAYLQRPRLGTAALAGALLGLAAFTRGNAIFLLPALLLAWWLAPKSGDKDYDGNGSRGSEEQTGGAEGMDRPSLGDRLRNLRWRDLGLAALAYGAFLSPLGWIRWRVFGDPFYSENYKNLAWKLYGYPDWSYLDRVPFESLGQIILADPLGVATGMLEGLQRFATGGLPQLLGTGLHALVLLAGAALAVGWRRRTAGWLVVGLTAALAATALAFFTWGRLLLYLLPALNALGAAGLALTSRGMDGAIPPHPRWRLRWRDLLLALLVVLLAAKTFGFRLPAFVDRHPVTEIATLRALEDELPEGRSLAGLTPFLDRYLERPYVALPDAFGEEVEDPALYFRRLRSILGDEDVAFVVASPLDLRDRPDALVGAEKLPPWLVPWAPDEDPELAEQMERRGVRVWRVEL
ncbi:MAG: glycosyltransferase family 39 protein [Acidobacteriota bacterium]|nr:glycosyltransferase family 39 protein [Acidobacteriota bacterium]